VLAYVFWHRPAGAGGAAYEARLAAFHRALGRTSAALWRPALPWLAGAGPGYEDWYLVADWAALGQLNLAAVSGARSAPHDAVAALAREGQAGVYAPLHGGEPVAGDVTWLAKPPGTSYADFHEELGKRPAWQRQMTLGPAPEYVVEEPEVPWPAARVRREQLC